MPNHKKFKAMIILLLIFLLSSCKTVITEIQGIHGMWFRPPADSAELMQSLKNMKKLGINTVFIETFYHSWTIYPGENSVQRPEFTGWDPLKMTLDYAHTNNMEVHAWIEVFYAFNPDYLDGTRGPVLTQHPDWLLESNDPSDPFSEEGKLYFNPAHPEVKDYLLSMMKELITLYPVDGVHLDYIRYPVHTRDKQFGFDSVSRELFFKETGLKLTSETVNDEKLFNRFAEWKINNVTRFVKNTVDVLKTINPHIQISAAIFPSYRNDPESLSKYQDWGAWVKGDMLDFITPMCYGYTGNTRHEEIRESLKLSDVPVVIGLAINRVKNPRDVEKLMGDGLTEGSAGIAWFAYNWQTPVFTKTLIKHFEKE